MHDQKIIFMDMAAEIVAIGWVTWPKGNSDGTAGRDRKDMQELPFFSLCLEGNIMEFFVVQVVSNKIKRGALKDKW